MLFDADAYADAVSPSRAYSLQSAFDAGATANNIRDAARQRARAPCRALLLPCCRLRAADAMMLTMLPLMFAAAAPLFDAAHMLLR